MKINRFETHDRLIEFNKQKDIIAQGCLDCINNRPSEFGNHPFYIFAHCRTHDNGYSKRMIWEPRLTKPKAQTNSMLFKAYPPGDNVRPIWMIPERSMWKEYDKGLMLHENFTSESIHNFQYNRALLEAPEPDDLPDFKIKEILMEIGRNYKKKNDLKKLAQAAIKRASEEASSILKE